MNKIYRFLGKKGRTTIPTYIRSYLQLNRGDLISYTINDKSIVIEKEKLCDKCCETNRMSELAEQMTAQEQMEMLTYLLEKMRKERVE